MSAPRPAGLPAVRTLPHASSGEARPSHSFVLFIVSIMRMHRPCRKEERKAKLKAAAEKMKSQGKSTSELLLPICCCCCLRYRSYSDSCWWSCCAALPLLGRSCLAAPPPPLPPTCGAASYAEGAAPSPTPAAGAFASSEYSLPEDVVRGTPTGIKGD